MKKEFVPYELAVKLKELGFDEPCVAIFGRNNELSVDDSFYKQENYHKDTVLAPTFSQCFRWFREKYDLFGCIDLHPSTPIHWYIRIDDVIENDYIYHSEDEGLKFGTYEMGELACLDKLIEIVETKSK